ncbi:hypothetical protein OIU85_005545 [Salix viminalis]|uniref:Uncharacterized protein n=1 Tax=Salix viminalis TaxID=40686 RepID=A0A9Q0ST67_SALVM|nr:hypothetical protein OIU85_005545 [Salix viminalis]
MEDEIIAEFNKSGFALDEEEILKEIYFAVAGMICCDGEGRQNEKVHHAAKQVRTARSFLYAIHLHQSTCKEHNAKKHIRNFMIKSDQLADIFKQYYNDAN